MLHAICRDEYSVGAVDLGLQRKGTRFDPFWKPRSTTESSTMNIERNFIRQIAEYFQGQRTEFDFPWIFRERRFKWPSGVNC